MVIEVGACFRYTVFYCALLHVGELLFILGSMNIFEYVAVGRLGIITSSESERTLNNSQH